MRLALVENRIAGTGIGMAGATAFAVMGGDGSGYGSAGGAACLLLALASLVLAYRSVRLGLVIEGDEVVVRNLFATTALRRAEAAGIDIRRRRFGGSPVVQLERRDGRRVTVQALEPAALRHNLGRAERLVRDAADALRAPMAER